MASKPKLFVNNSSIIRLKFYLHSCYFIFIYVFYYAINEEAILNIFTLELKKNGEI